MVSVSRESVFVLDSEVTSVCKTGEDFVCFLLIKIIAPIIAAAIGAPIRANVEMSIVGCTGFVVGRFVVGRFVVSKM